ncbi:hypothetical protein D3C85_1368230 [compost metagenome]
MPWEYVTPPSTRTPRVSSPNVFHSTPRTRFSPPSAYVGLAVVPSETSMGLSIWKSASVLVKVPAFHLMPTSCCSVL